MKNETKTEEPTVKVERESAKADTTIKGGSSEYPFYIVLSPPVPGQTSWSIVPW